MRPRFPTRSCGAAVALAAILLSGSVRSQVPSPVGQWDFDDTRHPLAATTGQDLVLSGSQQLIPGPGPDNHAVRVGVGTHYLCTHGIAPEGPGSLVNRYSLLFDFRIPQVGPWYCFFQTDPANGNDGDCFIRANSGTIGVSQTGYSGIAARVGAWQRLIVSVDNAAGRYRIYLDGNLILDGTPQAIDGRFALAPTLLLFADENGEDAPIDIARVAIYDRSLTAAEAAELGGFSGEGGGNAEFVTPPYLQNVKPDGITVMWELDAWAEAVVEYGPDAGYGLEMPGIGMASGAGTVIYKCVLTGLEPDATYHYRVRVGAVESPDGTFTTAPDGPGEFTFSVWSDSQGTNHGAYGADPYEPTMSMFSHMAGNGVDFGVGVGDLAENGASYGDVRQYYLDRVALLLGQTAPWFVAWGNHDQGRNAVIRKFADLPSQDRPGFTPGYGSYSFDHAGCHFICIDHATSGSDIAGWLEEDLRSPANAAAKFTFLFIHVPPYCELWIDGNASLRASLVPLMERYGVDVCFSGHTHEYSRGYRNGVFYCITGGGSWLDTPEVLVHSWEHMTVGGYHPIDGLPTPAPGRGGGLVNEYVRVEVAEDSFTASMIAFEPNGRVIGVLDQFSKSAGGEALPPGTPRMAGPTVLDVTTTPALVLRCSAFSAPDWTAQHASSVWRLSRSADPLDEDAILAEETTGPGVFSWWVTTDRLEPGQTVHATVRHLAADGSSSEWAAPWAVRLLPDIPRIVRVERIAEGLRLEWTGASGPCQVQFSPGLGTGSWIDVGEPVESSRPEAILSADAPVGFYRVRSLP